MKPYIYFRIIFVLMVFNCNTITANGQFYLGITRNQVGQTYQNGLTASIECNATVIDVSAGKFDDFINEPVDWVISSNFSYSLTPGDPYLRAIRVTLDPNRNDGFIGFNSSGTLTLVYIQQKPTPSFTVNPLLCSVGQSGNYAVTMNFFGPGTSNVIWGTTGGVTVNGSNYYRVNGNTLSSAIIQHNSYGTITVSGELPGCNYIRSNYATYHVGTPTGSNISFVGNPDPGSSLNSGQSYHFASNLALPPKYSYSWSVPQGQSNVGYFYGYGPNVTVSSATQPNTGGFVVQMGINNSECSNTGTSSRTFFYGGGYYRIANNPTSDQVTILFEPTEDSESLPSSLQLVHDKGGIVKELKINKKDVKESAKLGLTLDINVKDLAKDVYYLQGIFDNGTVKSMRVVIQ